MSLINGGITLGALRGLVDTLQFALRLRGFLSRIRFFEILHLLSTVNLTFFVNPIYNGPMFNGLIRVIDSGLGLRRPTF